MASVSPIWTIGTLLGDTFLEPWPSVTPGTRFTSFRFTSSAFCSFCHNVWSITTCDIHDRLRLAPVYRDVCRVCRVCVVIAHNRCTRYRPRTVYVLAISSTMCVVCVVTFQVSIYTYAKTAFSVFKFLLLNF